ncbi:hypothetical protein ACET3X_001112 [Alternaria dauci]|uniref:Uncharacterized protein n=1 Tax=Alternaria dauci TaxID=48095 RepID=A0ABR3UWW0_9PLEO
MCIAMDEKLARSSPVVTVRADMTANGEEAVQPPNQRLAQMTHAPTTIHQLQFSPAGRTPALQRSTPFLPPPAPTTAPSTLRISTTVYGRVLDAGDMTPSSCRLVPFSTLLLAWPGFVLAGDTITSGKIKVQLFAAPSFLSEVSVDAYNNQCLSLDNNLIDGRVQSILVGGHDVATVLQRDDYWSCRFYDNYDCNGDDDMDRYLAISDGTNNLGSIGWGTKIHGLKCCNREYYDD